MTPFDVLAEHGIAGMVGLLFNGILARLRLSAMTMSRTTRWRVGSTTTGNSFNSIRVHPCNHGYSAGVTAVLCFVINYIPGLQLRVDYNGEEKGVDEDQIGEVAYDYVEVRRDFWTGEFRQLRLQLQKSTNGEIFHAVQQATTQQHSITEEGARLGHRFMNKDTVNRAHVVYASRRFPERNRLSGYTQ